MSVDTKRGKLEEGKYVVRYVESDRKPIEQLLDMFTGALVKAFGPQLAARWLPVGTVPAAAVDAVRDMRWLSAVTEGQRPFMGVVHCLCGTP